MTERDDRFVQGDRIIRASLVSLAQQSGVRHRGIDLHQPYPGNYLYRLLGTEKSIALRAKEIRYAADPERRAKLVTPRLRAMFKELWWEQALVLLGWR